MLTEDIQTIDRRTLLPELFADSKDHLFVAGLAGAAKDTAAWTSDGDNLFAFGGAMGAALSTGLGLAMCATNENVVVITGDGELLMNAGSLATIASAGPSNLSIVCVDNGQHGETGGQWGHTSQRTNLALLAQGAGIASVMTVSTLEQLPDAKDFLESSKGPRFLCARVLKGPPSDFKRNWNPAECRIRFKKALTTP